VERRIVLRRHEEKERLRFAQRSPELVAAEVNRAGEGVVVSGFVAIASSFEEAITTIREGRRRVDTRVLCLAMALLQGSQWVSKMQ